MSETERQARIARPYSTRSPANGRTKACSNQESNRKTTVNATILVIAQAWTQDQDVM